MSMGIRSEVEGEARLLLGYFPIKWQGYLLFLKFWNSVEEPDKMIPALEEFLMGTKLFTKGEKKIDDDFRERIRIFHWEE